MARIAFVVFSMSLIISMQFMGGQSKEETPKEEKKDNKESVPGVNKEEDKQVTENEVMKDISEWLQDLETSSSPQQEEEFLMKIFFKTMKNMAAEGRLDPKVLKERLFSRGGETIDPKIKRAIIEAYGLIQQQKMEDGLWQIVGRYGEVLSVYIPKKRSRACTSCISVSCSMYSLKVPKEGSYGHVDEDSVRKLKRCLVGVMAGVCSVGSIIDRLHNWGLGEIKVQRLHGNSFLLTIEDEDLFIMLEDLQWTYLKEIFVDIMLWTESICQIERVVWIEIDGLPLHCWNEVTLKRLVGLWGRFEAFGENVYHHIDCGKVNMLISTSAEARIDEAVDVVVENKKFIIEDEKDGVEVGADKEGISSVNFSVNPLKASESGSLVDNKGSPLFGGGTFDGACTGDSLGVRNKVNVGKPIKVGCGIEEGRERVGFQISDHSNHVGLQGLDIDEVEINVIDSNVVKPIIDGVSRLDDRVMDGAFVVGSPEIGLP
ncbi:hypothetical protein F3Y22_tig00110458pilonHSYRG00103 [Hibiscus syriacus]|uniref:Uncharacterized protein n=1 Tax=Hibiscus syriacus TaxID=106335 RepID=A0A6A3ALS0_HIBSY|nr:hypothetical protein F3Y22_tig00110458pilonHSYRG00103 [Hibiscus syriacus]